MGWASRLRRAGKKNQKLKGEINTAKQALQLEGENQILQAQFGILEEVQRKLVNAELKGLKQGLKKQLPQVVKARQESGEKQIGTYLNSVRERALPQSK